MVWWEIPRIVRMHSHLRAIAFCHRDKNTWEEQLRRTGLFWLTVSGCSHLALLLWAWSKTKKNEGVEGRGRGRFWLHTRDGGKKGQRKREGGTEGFRDKMHCSSIPPSRPFSYEVMNRELYQWIAPLRSSQLSIPPLAGDQTFSTHIQTIALPQWGARGKLL